MFRFEPRDVPADADSWLAERFGRKRGGWLYGRMGTGKSHAVRKVVQEGIHIDVAPGPLLGQRFAVDLARQLGAEGRPLLEAFRSKGIEASLRIAAQAVNGHPLVVDRVDALLPAAAGLDDPAATLWQDEKKVLLDWLRGRLDDSPTFLVGRCHPRELGSQSMFLHKAPEDSPIRLEGTPDGSRNWLWLASIADNNPAVLTLARALVPLLPASAFEALVMQASEDQATVPVLLQRLGQAFQSNAPPSWQTVLALVKALGEIPRDVIHRLLEGRAGVASAGREPEPLVEESSTLDRLRDLKLIEERSGVLSLLPTLVDADAVRDLTQDERRELLPVVALQLLAPVNDVRSLTPDQADRVLRAHSIYVELEDPSMAERTAVLHVHGLVELARRTSQKKDYADAWRQYDVLLRMMQQPGTGGTDDRIGRRLRSYVRHYHARDGALARMLDDATCLAEYRQALAGWPENALWHQRYIEALLRLGRPIEARAAVDEAYALVPLHPRRDSMLRVHPAGAALRAGFPFLSLELIEPVLDLPEDQHPEVADGRRVLLRNWEKGIAVSELPFRLGRGDADGCVVLHVPLGLTLRRAGDTWVARLHDLAREGRAERPRAAIEELAHYLAGETRRLVSTPTSSLGDRDVRLKGRLLSMVDVLNSDIGLKHATERWIVGRIQGNELFPTMQHLPRIEIPDALLPESTEGLYFAQVPVHRDGVPAGPATRLTPAGSSFAPDALFELLTHLSEDVE